MALRLLIQRSVVARRIFLQLRRCNNSSEISGNNKIEDITKTAVFKKAENYESGLFKVLDAHENKETVRCGQFCDEDRTNTDRFADDCTVSSFKFAYDDTINATKFIDEDTIGCAKFAVDEIARANKTNIEFVRVLKGSRTPSWSHDHQIILEAVNKDSGEKRLYYAEVQSQLWIEEEPFKLTTWMSE